MIYDVYVDLFFLINFSMDYICLYITAKILKHNVSAKKYIISSIVGGLYSVLSLFLSPNPVIAIIIDGLVCLIMIAICFYSKGENLKLLLASSLLYIGISMLLGGVMTTIFNILNRLDLDFGELSDDGAHTYAFAIIAIISAAISVKGISIITKKNRHKEYFVTVIMNKKVCKLLGFVDTGNLIKDSISGKSIIFIDRAAASEIIDPSVEEKFYRGEILFPRSRLIPISTANGSSMALIFVPDSVTLKEKSQQDTKEFHVDCLISLTDIKGEDAANAIIPEDIIKLNI